jgi:predicted hydrocarbon binding protein
MGKEIRERSEPKHILNRERLLERRKAIVMRNGAFGELQKELERTFSRPAANVMLVRVGRACGKRSVLRLKTTIHGKVDLLNALTELKSEERWCTLSYEDFNLKDRCGKIVTKDSFEADGYGESETPVCWFLQGYLEGALSEITASAICLNQTSCVAKGDQRCVFEVTKKDAIEDRPR